MAQIELRQVAKKFGNNYAVRPMDLTIRDGQFVVLLGPSGCGKTTTLRMISGLEAVTTGQILINDRDVTWNHPSDRDIAFVFQFFALYPLMTVRENIAFTLEAQGIQRNEVNQRVADVAKLLQISHLLKYRPRSLSGGDRQRVALARALVRRPSAFLMDEPLGALDAEFRSVMRSEIRRLHLEQGATTVYVTHDQIEAMAMSDVIVVMSNATVQQIGTPAEVYSNPANLFVARFIGSPGMNLICCRYQEGTVLLPGGHPYRPNAATQAKLDQAVKANEVIVGFRPETVLLSNQGTIPAGVYADEMHGAFTMLHLTLAGDQTDSIVHVRSDRTVHFKIGEQVRFDLDPKHLRFFDVTTELAIC